MNTVNQAEMANDILSEVRDATLRIFSEEAEDPRQKSTGEKQTIDLPIVRIDRATGQDLLPVFMERGIFSNFSELRNKEDILEEARINSGKGKLTPIEEREVLAVEQEYREGHYVVRDYKDHAIGFAANMFVEHLMNEEKRFTDDQKNCMDSREELGEERFNKYSDEITRKLSEIKLYKIAHRLAFAILAEVYQQKSLTITVAKTRLISLLGYTVEEHGIYRDIWNALDSLRWLEYKFFRFSLDKRKKTNKPSSEAVGWFVYNIVNNASTYTLSVNPVFVGCVHSLFAGKLPEEDLKNTFERGYYKWPSSILPLTKDYSTPAYLLTQFLIREVGNKKLAEPGFKVVSFTIDRFIKEAKISFSQFSKAMSAMVKAFQEVEIINRTDPSLEDLSKIKPANAREMQLRVWIQTPEEVLDEHIKGKIKSRGIIRD